MATKDEIFEFSNTIEKMVANHRIGYLESVLLYCEQCQMEPEIAVKLISSGLMAKIEAEAARLNLLKKSTKINQLPL